MTGLLLIGLTIMLTSLLFWGFRRPERMIQYPFLAGAVFAGWVLPQLIGLNNNPCLALPSGALEKTIIMTLLCIIAIYVGHVWHKEPLRTWDWTFSRKRLLIAASVLSISGAYFYFKVSLLAEAVTAETGGQWSGPITIYAFFASLLTFGLVLAILSHMKQPSRWALVIVLFDLIFYFNRIVMRGRRQAAAELAVILGLAFWFQYRKLPPRWFVAVVLIVGALWVNSVGQYRANMMGREGSGFHGAFSIDYIDNFKAIFAKGGLELTNTVYDIEGSDRLSNFDFGLRHWNGFVQNFIPGQVIGNDLKKTFMVDLGNSARMAFQHVAYTGSTHTGMSDAFSSFWYFGAMKFFIIAFIVNKLYSAANRGHMVAQMLIMLVFVGGLESITHTTDRFFMAWPKIAVFLLPALMYARARRVRSFRHSLSNPVRRVRRVAAVK